MEESNIFEIQTSQEILERACYYSFYSYYNCNQNKIHDSYTLISNSYQNSIEAIFSSVNNNDYTYITHKDNVRNNMMLLGSVGIKKELLKHCIKLTILNKEEGVTLIPYNEKTNLKNFKTKSYNDLVTEVFYGIKYGEIDSVYKKISNPFILKNLIKSYIYERMANKKGDKLDSVILKNNSDKELINNIKEYTILKTKKM